MAADKIGTKTIQTLVCQIRIVVPCKFSKKLISFCCVIFKREDLCTIWATLTHSLIKPLFSLSLSRSHIVHSLSLQLMPNTTLPTHSLIKLLFLSLSLSLSLTLSLSLQLMPDTYLRSLSLFIAHNTQSRTHTLIFSYKTHTGTLSYTNANFYPSKTTISLSHTNTHLPILYYTFPWQSTYTHSISLSFFLSSL